MTRKSQYRLGEKGAEVSELLDTVEALLDRTKVLYEQYFMGIQKRAPDQLHRDVERKIRELTRLQIRNTALRYRLTTITQKFGVYNTYWRRILRQIEQGTYVRDIARVSRRAQQRGEDLPEEILAAMPKRMRDRILRDRELLAKRQAREAGGAEGPDQGDQVGQARRASDEPRSHVHQLDESLLGGDFGDDFEQLFSDLTSKAEKAVDAHASKPAPSKPAAAKPAARPPIPARKRPGPPPIPGQASQASKASGSKGGALPPGMTEAKTRDLYQRYVKARQQVGDKGNVSYDKLVQSLNKQAPKIMQQHKAKGVEFDVVVKDDKVVLKAKPKR